YSTPLLSTHSLSSHDTSPTALSTLSLHDALPISRHKRVENEVAHRWSRTRHSEVSQVAHQRPQESHGLLMAPTSHSRGCIGSSWRPRKGHVMRADTAGPERDHHQPHAGHHRDQRWSKRADRLLDAPRNGL